MATPRSTTVTFATSNSSSSMRPGRRFQEQLVHVAPAPVLARLQAADQRVLALTKVLRRVFVNRVVATADVAAAETQPQVDPAAPHLQTFFAAPRRARGDVTDLVEVRTLFVHDSRVQVERSLSCTENIAPASSRAVTAAQ